MPSKPSYPLAAQAETLLIYGIFLFLTGLAQIGVTVSHRYILEKSIDQHGDVHLRQFFPKVWTLKEMHLWYIYPSAALTLVPFLASIAYALFKRRMMTVLICISSLVGFISASVYIGLLIVHTLEYWQTISSHRYKSLLSTATTTSSTRLLLALDEPATFANLALLITFTLALVQALLSMIGAVISCLWSPCCFNNWSPYTPIVTSSHYVQTTPHRHDNAPSSTLRSIQRQQQHSDAQRYITANGHHHPPPARDLLLNGFLSKSPPNRSHYDDV